MDMSTKEPPDHRLLLGRYRLLNAFPNVLILLPTVAAPPSCMLLASASSSADCVTDASVHAVSQLHKTTDTPLPAQHKSQAVLISNAKRAER